MNKIAVLIILSVAFGSALSDDWRETCNSMASFSESVMKGRQKGVSMSKMIEASDQNKVLEAIIIDAYDTPRFHTDSNQKRAIEEFRDEIYLQCAKSLR